MVSCVLVLVVFCLTPLVSSEPDNFVVTWHDCKFGLTQHTCLVDIQNIYTELDKKGNPVGVDKDFNLSALLSDTNYDLSEYVHEMTIYEWKPLPTEFHTYNTTLIYLTCYNETWDETNTTLISNESYDCSYNLTQQNGTEIKDFAQWKLTKSNMLKEGVKDKMYYGTILIPKYESKPKEDDLGTMFTVNGTKYFKIEWITPITQTENGWGSSGQIILMDELTGYDYE